MGAQALDSADRPGEEKSMPREFYTEKDIEDMHKGGILSLEVNDKVVLTELAYEKARALGMQLVQEKPELPPAAPVRPYLSNMSRLAPARPPDAGKGEISPESQKIVSAAPLPESDLQKRIRDAVVARLGPQVDAGLLDVIIKRVLASTGLQ
jgi:hypothetical protein